MDRGEDVVIGRETAPTDVASGNNWRPRKPHSIVSAGQASPPETGLSLSKPPRLNVFRSSGFCRQQLAEIFIELTDCIRIGAE
jgi:hypothetical protein